MDVRKELEQTAEEKYRLFTQKLLPGTTGILGVRIPKLRMLAKKIAKENPKEYIEAKPTSSYEEKMLWGMVIGYADLEKQERENALRAFVPDIDNWSVCDSSCATYHFMKEDRETWWRFLQEFFDAGEEYHVRFALVCGLDFFIEDDYIDAFLEKLDGFSQDGYYAKMAAAWAVSMCYVNYKEKTTRFLERCKWDDFTYKKAIQKIKESRCVTEQEKRKEVQTLWESRF